MKTEVELLHSASPVASKLYLFLRMGVSVLDKADLWKTVGLTSKTGYRALAELKEVGLVVDMPKRGGGVDLKLPLADVTAPAVYIEPVREEAELVEEVKPIQISIPLNSHQQGVSDVRSAFKLAWPGFNLSPAGAQDLIQSAGKDANMVVGIVEAVGMQVANGKVIEKPVGYVKRIIASELEKRATQPKPVSDQELAVLKEETERNIRAFKMKEKRDGEIRPHIPKPRARLEERSTG